MPSCMQCFLVVMHRFDDDDDDDGGGDDDDDDDDDADDDDDDCRAPPTTPRARAPVKAVSGARPVAGDVCRVRGAVAALVERGRPAAASGARPSPAPATTPRRVGPIKSRCRRR